MTDQRKRMEQALRGCAESGVPDTVDLWPAIRERAGGAQMDAAPASEERTTTSPRQRSRIPQFVPNTYLGRVLAVVSALLLGVGIYAASGPVQELFRAGLSDAGGPGIEEGTGLEQTDDGTGNHPTHGLLYRQFRGELPGAKGRPAFGEKLDLQRTADGARVSLEWAYADESSVVVGFGIEDLREERRVAGRPVKLEPFVVAADEESPDFQSVYEDWPVFPRLTDGGDIDVSSDGVSWQGSEDVPSTAVFAPGEKLEPGEKRRFRLVVPVQASPQMPRGTSSEDRPPSEQPVGERPFAIDFEVPVRAAPVVKVNQADTVKGVTLTLDRMVDSPGRPAAIICFESPDNELDWIISDFVGASVPGKSGNNCREVLLPERLDGSSSVTVTHIEGFPPPGTPGSDKELNEMMKTIRGPWTFEFKVPEW